MKEPPSFQSFVEAPNEASLMQAWLPTVFNQSITESPRKEEKRVPKQAVLGESRDDPPGFFNNPCIAYSTNYYTFHSAHTHTHAT